MPFDPNAFTEDVRRRREQQPSLSALKQQSDGFQPNEFTAGSTSVTPYSERPVTGSDVATTAATGAGSAAATAFGYNMIPGMKGPVITPGMAYDAVGRPLIQSSGQLYQQYVADPFRAGRDIAASKVAPGVIPAQVVRGAAPEIAERINNIIGQLPKGTDVNADQFLRGLTNEDKMKFVQQVEKDGLEKAFKNFQAPKYLDEAGQTALKGVQKAFPSGMAKLGTAAGMLARTAGRFAGPVGLGMTAYDIYEYGPKIYDYVKEQMNPPAAPVTPNATAPQMAPIVPDSTGAATFDMDRRIREEAYKRAIGQQ